MTEVSPLPANGDVFLDPRDASRSLRLSWHPEVGMFVVSMWRRESCLSSFPLAPAEAARLVHDVTTALAGGFPLATAEKAVDSA
jgi:hypothetical protein